MIKRKIYSLGMTDHSHDLVAAEVPGHCEGESPVAKKPSFGGWCDQSVLVGVLVENPGVREPAT